jgi:hypothetical protein
MSLWDPGSRLPWPDGHLEHGHCLPGRCRVAEFTGESSQSSPVPLSMRSESPAAPNCRGTWESLHCPVRGGMGGGLIVVCCCHHHPYCGS